MQVSVIKTTEPKNVSIPAAMAVGGVAGLGLRYAIPVYKPEMDYFVFNKSDVMKEDNVKAVKKNVIEKAQDLLKKDKDNEALKLFIKRAKVFLAEYDRNFYISKLRKYADMKNIFDYYIDEE